MIELLTIALLIILLYILKKHRGFTLASFGLTIYIVSLVAAYFLKSEPTYAYITLNYETILYFLAMLLLFLSPTFFVDTSKILEFKTTEKNKIHILGYVLISLSFLVLIFYIPLLLQSFQGDLLQRRTEAINDGVINQTGIIAILMFTIIRFYPVLISMFFYTKITNDFSKKFSLLLILSSTVYVIATLSWVGRDGIIYWIIMYLINYMLFGNFLSKKQKINLIRPLIYFGAVFLIFFLLITIARFKDSDYGIMYSIKDYIGQPILNFSNIYNNYNVPPTNGQFTMQFFWKYFDNKEIGDFSDTAYYAKERLGINLFTFPTFIGSLVMDYGKTTTCVIALIYFIIGYHFRIRNSKLTMHNVILLNFLTQIPIQGVFYFNLYDAGSNLYIMSIPIIYIFFRYKIKF